MLTTNMRIVGYSFIISCLVVPNVIAEGVSLKLVSMFQSGGGISGMPLKPLILLPSKGATSIEDTSLADIFLVVKNDSQNATRVISEPRATFSLTLYSYSPTIDEIKNMPKQATYQFVEKFPHQPMDYTLLPGEARIYEINCFKNQKMIADSMSWLWVTGISKIKVQCRLHFEDGDVALNTGWMPVEVQVPQLNTAPSGNH